MQVCSWIRSHKNSNNSLFEHFKIKLPTEDRSNLITSFHNVSTDPSVDAVTTATFPSSLRLVAAVELILISDLKAPENLQKQTRCVIFQDEKVSRYSDMYHLSTLTLPLP